MNIFHESNLKENMRYLKSPELVYTSVVATTNLYCNAIPFYARLTHCRLSSWRTRTTTYPSRVREIHVILTTGVGERQEKGEKGASGIPCQHWRNFSGQWRTTTCHWLMGEKGRSRPFGLGTDECSSYWPRIFQATVEHLKYGSFKLRSSLGMKYMPDFKDLLWKKGCKISQ